MPETAPKEQKPKIDDVCEALCAGLRHIAGLQLVLDKTAARNFFKARIARLVKKEDKGEKHLLVRLLNAL